MSKVLLKQPSALHISCYFAAKQLVGSATSALLLAEGCLAVFVVPQSCDTDPVCNGPIVTDDILAWYNALYDSWRTVDILDSVLTDFANQFHADHNHTPAPIIYEYTAKKVFRVEYPLYLTYLGKSFAHWLRHNMEIRRGHNGWWMRDTCLPFQTIRNMLVKVTFWLRVCR